MRGCLSTRVHNASLSSGRASGRLASSVAAALRAGLIPPPPTVRGLPELEQARNPRRGSNEQDPGVDELAAAQRDDEGGASE